MSSYIFPMVTGLAEKLPFLVTGIGIHHEQEHVRRPDGYPFYQWIQCYKGQGILLLNGMEYTVHENQGMLLSPDEPHEYFAVTSNWTVDWISFGGYHTSELLKRLFMSNSGVYYMSHPEILLSKMRMAYMSALSEDDMSNSKCSILAYDILINLYKYTSKDPVNSTFNKYLRLTPVLEYIEKNYDRQLSLDELSAILGISPQHLCNLFKSLLKIRPFEYLNKVRIQKSKKLILAHKEKLIKEIASLSGFTDFSYFCSVFKKVENISPGNFRKLYGN